MSGFSIHRKYVERVTLTGSGNGACKAIFAYCQRNNFHVIQSGFYGIKAKYADIDTDGLRIVAEREMELLIEPLIVDQRRTTEYGTIGCEE